MKTLHEFADTLKAALAVVEGANAAEERAKAAQQAAASANALRMGALDKAAKLKAETDAEIAARMAKLERAEQESAAKLVAQKAECDGYVANARAQVETASETLTALQLQIGEARKTRDEINAELAKLRAAFAESASKL